MPSVDGQISLLISFICHSWWLAPSFEPAATHDVAARLGVVAAVRPALDRGGDEAGGDVLVRRVAVEPAGVGPDRVLQHADADVLVADTTLKSSGVYSSPVSGFSASSTWAYSL